MLGVPINRIEMEKHASDYADDHGGDFHRQAARIAALAYEAVDRQGCLGYHLYDRLSKQARWDPGWSPLMDPLYRALAVVSAPHMTKSAASPLKTIMSGLAGLAPAAATISAETLRYAMLASLASGAGLGSLYWGANRHVKEDEKDTEALKTKVDYYDQLTRQIENEVQRKQRGV